jgi:uncharacterized protein YoxC
MGEALPTISGNTANPSKNSFDKMLHAVNDLSASVQDVQVYCHKAVGQVLRARGEAYDSLAKELKASAATIKDSTKRALIERQIIREQAAARRGGVGQSG